MRSRVFVAAGLAIFLALGVAAVRSVVSPATKPSATRPVDVGGTDTTTASTVASNVAANPALAPTESTPRERRRPSVSPPASDDTVAAATSSAHRDRVSRRSTDELITTLASTDDFAVQQAADELVHRKAVQAIGTLAAIDITKGPRAAPSVIDALGRLAALADPADKKTGTDRLLALLAQERARGAPESAGNVLTLYEALGETGDPRAASALEAELIDPKVTLAAKTVIIDALVKLHQPSSVAALKTLQQSLGSVTPKDKMDESILRELNAAIERALRTFS